MSRLDEVEMRREGWCEEAGAWIALADGQRWLLPKPRAALSPAFYDGKFIGTSLTTWGLDYDELLTRMASLDDAEALFEVAHFLIARNYDVPDASYPELIHWKPDEPENFEMWQEIVRHANGRGAPKLAPAVSS